MTISRDQLKNEIIQQSMVLLGDLEKMTKERSLESSPDFLDAINILSNDIAQSFMAILEEKDLDDSQDNIAENHQYSSESEQQIIKSMSSIRSHLIKILEIKKTDFIPVETFNEKEEGIFQERIHGIIEKVCLIISQQLVSAIDPNDDQGSLSSESGYHTNAQINDKIRKEQYLHLQTQALELRVELFNDLHSCERILKFLNDINVGLIKAKREDFKKAEKYLLYLDTILDKLVGDVVFNASYPNQELEPIDIKTLSAKNNSPCDNREIIPAKAFKYILSKLSSLETKINKFSEMINKNKLVLPLEVLKELRKPVVIMSARIESIKNAKWYTEDTLSNRTVNFEEIYELADDQSCFGFGGSIDDYNPLKISEEASGAEMAAQKNVQREVAGNGYLRSEIRRR